MRGQSITALLIYEAKRRPPVAELVERVTTMTDADIDAAVVPMLWYKRALKELRREKNEGDLIARMTALIEKHVVDGVMPDPMGETRQWLGGATFLNIDRGGQIEVKPNDLLWLPDNGGIWIGTVYAKVVDPRVHVSSQSLGRSPKSGYINARAR